MRKTRHRGPLQSRVNHLSAITGANTCTTGCVSVRSTVAYIAILAAALIPLAVAHQAHASISLNPIQDGPDIFATLRGNYNATSNILTVNGGSFASRFDVGYGGPVYTPFMAPVIINLKVDDSGIDFSAPPELRQLKIRVASPQPNLPGYPVGDLLVGDITDAAITAPGVLQMLFVVNSSGSAASDFGGAGALGGLTISMLNSGTSAATVQDFLASFSLNSGMSASTMDAFNVTPEPGSFFVFAGLTLTAGLLISRSTNKAGLAPSSPDAL